MPPPKTLFSSLSGVANRFSSVKLMSEINEGVFTLPLLPFQPLVFSLPLEFSSFAEN